MMWIWQSLLDEQFVLYDYDIQDMLLRKSTEKNPS